MAIEKNYVKAPPSRLDSEFSVGSRSRESLSTDDDDDDDEQLHMNKNKNNSVDSVDVDDDDDYDDADSGAGSDDFDLLELGETRSEFCQVGDQTCSIPFELYDLPDLHDILSLDVWNNCLTEEDRFGLTRYLPDVDEATFMQTLKELFEGANFHFSSPITTLFQMLKGGLCEPRVALYRQGLTFFHKHKHYHSLRNHQDSMVAGFLQMNEAWQNCNGYSIEEKLRILNIFRSRKSLVAERTEDIRSDSSEREASGEALWGNKRSKGRMALQKAGHTSPYVVSPDLDAVSQGQLVAIDPCGKKNPKGLLKVVGSKTVNEITPGAHSRQYGYPSINADAYKPTIYDDDTPTRLASSNDRREGVKGMASRKDWNVEHCNVIDRGRSSKSGKKKREVPRVEEYDGDSYLSLPFAAKNISSGHGGNLNINQLSDIKVLTAKPSNVRALYGSAKKAKCVESTYENPMRPAKYRAKQMGPKRNLSAFSNIDLSHRSKDGQGEVYFAEPSSFDYEDGNAGGGKYKFRRELPDFRLKSLQTSHHMDSGVCHSEKRIKLLQDNFEGASFLNGHAIVAPIGDQMFPEGEETESDSSEQHDEEDNQPSLVTKLGIPGDLEKSHSLTRSSFEQKEKHSKKIVKGGAPGVNGIFPVSSTMGDTGMPMPEIPKTYPSKYRHKGKAQHPNMLQNFSSRVPKDVYDSGFDNTNIDNRKSAHRHRRNNDRLEGELAKKFLIPMDKASHVDRRQKGNVGHNLSLRQFKYLQDYSLEEGGGLFESDLGGGGARDNTFSGLTSSVKKQKRAEGSTEIGGQEGSDYIQSHQQLTSSRKRVKKSSEAGSDSLDAGSSELPVADVGMVDLELEMKPQKKTFILITPTVHTDFSFSVVHFLSAVRMALVTPADVEDSLEAGKHDGNSSVKAEDENGNQGHMNGSVQQLNVKNTGQHDPTNIPHLTVQEIVSRVRSNPGDPSILETQEPLLDLVRGVLKIFSSKTAPLGAKGWKPLVSYEKATKSWTWTGPTPQSSTDHGYVEEVTSPDAWRIHHKMLVKLVDSFANWLKSGQETLRQIGSLPAPPVELMQLNFDEKERFRDLRAQKSLSTISKSSEEVKAYFRREEQLRYSVPDRAFSYTAADGKKSIVAPLRRCGGKPTSKARDHFMLKRDRPPHVTILCLVRDAAARLPGSIGTRADVCTLLRDSQYIVDDVSDAQVNQVVSGALDRLHYERDPCVQFDSERKLWVYLHRDRDEEDFEDDGTSSTKKWKRQKKEASEPDDQVTVACHGSGEPSGGCGLRSDLNVVPPAINNDTVLDVASDATRQRPKDIVESRDIPEESACLQESRSHCQENSVNEDFVGDDT